MSCRRAVEVPFRCGSREVGKGKWWKGEKCAGDTGTEYRNEAGGRRLSWRRRRVACRVTAGSW